MSGQDKFEKIVDLALRRGFFWPSYEIYGGVGGFYDLGPLGTILKRNIEEKWREWFILKHQDMVVEIETPIIAPAKVFEASGHVEHFIDPIVSCLKCGRVYRADKLIEEKVGTSVEGLKPEDLDKIIVENKINCPACDGPLSKVKVFNLLFKTTIGPYSESVGYLRPETAQGMFTAFKRVYESMRNRIPLGIAQIGKVARNEISPRQGMIRLREFTIMEVEFFFDPEAPHCPLLEKYKNNKLRILSADLKAKGIKEPVEINVIDAVKNKVIKTPWLAYWMVISQEFVKDLGIPSKNMFFEEKMPHERAHYATQTFDQLVKVSRWGWVEVSGHAYRSDYDLSRHMEYSNKDLTVFKKYEKPRIIRKKRLAINKLMVKKLLRERAVKAFEILSKLSISEVENLIKAPGKFIILSDEIKVPKEFVKVAEYEEKVHGKKYVPHVVEPSFGTERLVYVTLEYAFSEEDGRIVLKLPKSIAPIKLAVFPLVNKKELIDKARYVYNELVNAGYTVFYDESGSIGRRYVRADEIGIPYAITVDYQTLEDHTVTIRDRDTRKQIRVKISELRDELNKLFMKS